MKTNDEKIFERLLRRIRSPRGTVFLEFAMFAPLAVILMCFAFDFSRILRVEQQLEIGARAMADLESHWAKRTSDGSPNMQTYPRTKSKTLVKTYLASTMPGLQPGNFYCKAFAESVPGLQSVLSTILNFINGTPAEGTHWVLKLIAKIIGKILNIFTLKTQLYFTEIIPRDQQLKVSFSATMPTLLPRRFYNVLGFASPTPVKAGTGLATISQLRQKIITSGIPGQNTLNPNERERFYCVMPVMDSAVQPPVTYGRQIKGAFTKYIPEWLQKILF